MLGFDEVAETYERVRPRMPEEVVERVLAHAGHPARMLEAGCGTGQATRAFAERGLAITALEPGPRLAARARRALPHVRVVTTKLEDWSPDRKFDLFLCAQALHWVDPARGAARVREAVRAGGTIALVWTFSPPGNAPIDAAITDAYRRCEPDSRSWPSLRERVRACREAWDLGPAESHRFVTEDAWTTSEYLDLMCTFSSHLRLPDARRRRLHAEIAAAIDAHGGTLRRRQETALYLHRA